MNLLVINKFYFMRGGCERYIFELNKVLEKNGVNIIPFSMEDDRNIPTEYSKYFVSNIDFQRRLNFSEKVKSVGRVLYSFEARNNILKLIDGIKPDIAHIHNIAHQISPSILTVLKKRGIPIVQTLHDFKLICPSYLFYVHDKPCEKCKDNNFYNAILNKCIKNSVSGSFLIAMEMYFHKIIRIYDNVDIFITPSIFMKNKLEAFGIDSDKLIHIPNFVLADSFVPNYDFKDYFIYFGRLSEEKGIRTLIKAMEKNWKTKLLVVGDGVLKNELKKYAEDKGFTNIIFTGYKSGDELNDLIRNAMFTIVPSECYENCPMAILESFAMGKPVIGSNIGGIPELISDGFDGLLFESGNEMDLKEKIFYLFNNSSKIKEMGKRGREKVEEKYSKELHYQKINKIYQKLLN